MRPEFRVVFIALAALGIGVSLTLAVYVQMHSNPKEDTTVARYSGELEPPPLEVRVADRSPLCTGKDRGYDYSDFPHFDAAVVTAVENAPLPPEKTEAACLVYPDESLLVVFPGNLLRYDVSRKRVVWIWSSGLQRITGTTLAADETVYVSTVDAKYDRFRLCSLGGKGRMNWCYSGSRQSAAVFVAALGDAGAPLLVDGTVLLGFSATGKLRFRTETGESILGVVPGPAGRAYVKSGKALRAIDANGVVAWSLPADAVVGDAGLAVAADGTAYSAGRDLIAMSADGHMRWKYPGKPRAANWGDGAYFPRSPLLCSDGIVFAGTQDGQILAFLPDGRVKWRYDSGSIAPIGLFEMDSRGVLSVSFGQIGNGSHLEFRHVCSGPMQHPWPMPRHDQRNTRALD